MKSYYTIVEDHDAECCKTFESYSDAFDHIYETETREIGRGWCSEIVEITVSHGQVIATRIIDVRDDLEDRIIEDRLEQRHRDSSRDYGREL